MYFVSHDSDGVYLFHLSSFAIFLFLFFYLFIFCLIVCSCCRFIDVVFPLFDEDAARCVIK